MVGRWNAGNILLRDDGVCELLWRRGGEGLPSKWLKTRPTPPPSQANHIPNVSGQVKRSITSGIILSHHRIYIHRYISHHRCTYTHTHTNFSYQLPKSYAKQQDHHYLEPQVPTHRQMTQYYQLCMCISKKSPQKYRISHSLHHRNLNLY